MFKRRLGRSGIKVSTMGLGCWAIGGPWTYDGREVGWSKIDDDESTRAIHKALDMGITFFDYTPMEASVMDPQQRLLLECAWQALEHAGYAGERDTDSIGVYAGSRINTYMENFFGHSDFMGAQGRSQIMLGNAEFALCMRISYKLNLPGPWIAFLGEFGLAQMEPTIRSGSRRVTADDRGFERLGQFVDD